MCFLPLFFSFVLHSAVSTPFSPVYPVDMPWFVKPSDDSIVIIETFFVVSLVPGFQFDSFKFLKMMPYVSLPVQCVLNPWEFAALSSSRASSGCSVISVWENDRSSFSTSGKYGIDFFSRRSLFFNHLTWFFACASVGTVRTLLCSLAVARTSQTSRAPFRFHAMRVVHCADVYGHSAYRAPCERGGFY
jgi:hypothetical protein